MSKTSKKPALHTWALTVGWASAAVYVAQGFVAATDERFAAKTNWQFLVYMAFLCLLRLKIGFDDSHYFRSRARPTKYASYGLAVGVVTYILWVVIPIVSVGATDRSEIYVLAILTIELSTIWIALTGLDVEEQKRHINIAGESDSVAAFKQINRFYKEQPWWIITNCFYIFFSGLLVYFDESKTWGIVAPTVLIAVLLLDWRLSNPFRYLLGDDEDAEVTCACIDRATNKVCGFPVGTGRAVSNFCPKCGGAQIKFPNS